jgi:hypothetical protein
VPRRALTLLWLLGACSLVTVTGPRARPPVYAPACRSSTTAPLADATLALAATTSAGLAAIDYHDCTGDHDHHCGLRAAAAATSLLAGLVLAVSAAYGFSTDRLCSDAEASHASYVRSRFNRRARP